MRYAWKVCAESSSIEFNLKYREIGVIKGCFRQFDGEIRAENAFERPEIRINISTSSVTAYQKNVDQAIVSRLFLAIEEFPLITFISKAGWRLSKGGVRELIGQIRVKGKVNIITLIVTTATIKTGRAKLIANFTMSTTLLLSDYGFEIHENIYSNELNVTVKMMLTANLNVL